MPLALNRYTIAVANDGLDLDKALEAGEGDGYQTHTVTVLHADQLVAEQAAPRYGVRPISEESPQKITWATLWVWCALRRQQVTVPEFPAFKSRILDLAVDTPTQDTDAPDLEAELDPTDPGPDTGWP